jgi:hypothetical protein
MFVKYYIIDSKSLTKISTFQDFGRQRNSSFCDKKNSKKITFQHFGTQRNSSFCDTTEISNNPKVHKLDEKSKQDNEKTIAKHITKRGNLKSPKITSVEMLGGAHFCTVGPRPGRQKPRFFRFFGVFFRPKLDFRENVVAQLIHFSFFSFFAKSH